MLTHNFEGTFADGHMTDAIKSLANDPATDKRVRKKLMIVLGSWRDQYKDDPSMSVVAGLYKQCRGAEPVGQLQLAKMMGLSPDEQKRIDKEETKKEAKRKAKQEREEAARRREEEEKKKNRVKRPPFDFEKVRLSSVGSLSYPTNRFLGQTEGVIKHC